MKERLTGAVILVALLVLLVPELLTGPGPSAPRQSAASDGGPLRSYTIDLAEGAAANRPGTVAPAMPVSDEPVELAQPQEGETAEETASAAAGVGPAGALQQPSPETGAPAGKEPAEVEQPRSAFGPNAASRNSAASQARSASQAGAAAPARAPGAAREPVTGNSPATGWMVQLGVFANRDNADRLARQVKSKGFAVVIQEISGSGGRRLHRVRVGPEPDRAAAVALGSKLQAAGYPGAVVAPP